MVFQSCVLSSVLCPNNSIRLLIEVSRTFALQVPSTLVQGQSRLTSYRVGWRRAWLFLFHKKGQALSPTGDTSRAWESCRDPQDKARNDPLVSVYPQGGCPTHRRVCFHWCGT